MCFGSEELLSKGTQQVLADWHLTAEAQRKESWWEVVGRMNISCWHMGHKADVLSPVWPCYTPHWRWQRSVPSFFFSSPEANKNDLLYPDKKTQNVSVGYMLFFYCLVDIRLIIYLSQQVWVRFHLEGLSLITVFTDRKPACFLSFPSAV